MPRAVLRHGKARGKSRRRERRRSQLTDSTQTPPCRHFGTCGGCSLQNQTDEAVAARKREGIVRALAGVGIEVPVAETLTVPARDRRRVKLSFQRTKKTTILGFMEAQSHRVVPITECHVARPEIIAALPALAAMLRPGSSRKGTLGATVTVSETGLDVSVADGKDLDLDLRQTLAAGARNTDLARLVWNEELIAARRPPLQRFGKALVTPPPGAFLQASATGEMMLCDLVRAGVGGAAKVIDLFAGCGAFSLPLSETALVTAVEGDSAMVAALDAGWRNAQGLKQVSAVTRDLFRRPMLPTELNPFDAIVFDPPRAGARAQAEQIASSTVPTVVGVSCMPTSFARDARLLVDGGYRLESVTPVDQFRWSPHTELVGVFRLG